MSKKSKNKEDDEELSVVDLAVNKKWEDRAKLLKEQKNRLRSGWRNDPFQLEQYFNSCVNSWKVYKGARTTKQVLKVHSIYKQATKGDSIELEPENKKSSDWLKWKMYQDMRGIPQDMAKRRFITYLAEINPSLIDVMPDEKPPAGFPHDREGKPICAKCNTTVGCTRPLLDQFKQDIRSQLFEDTDLHEPQALRRWVRNAMDNQRCVWGMHTAITEFQAKPFHAWFSRTENQGFAPYDSSTVMMIIRELLTFHFEIGYDMQVNLEEHTAETREYTPEAFNEQALKCSKLKGIYEELSHDKFVFEAPCRKFKDPLCNERRLADCGRNHKHPVEIEPPTKHDQGSYEEALELREQCKKLTLDIHTGPVESVHQRCEIYRNRIAEYFAGLSTSTKARENLEARPEIHKKEKKKIHDLTQEMLSKQCHDNCHANKSERVLKLVKRGCDPNCESPRGLTPLLCFITNEVPAEYFERILEYKVNLNYVNNFGFTPLMLSCRLRTTKMIHLLMKSGCSAIQSGGTAGNGMTAMHWCAVHSADEEAKIIYDYVKDGGGDAMRLTKLLDAKNDDGDTPLILAARNRNGLMCRVLTSIGASPNVRNNLGKNACFTARDKGWTELADWLEKKVGAGVAKVETYSDLQYDQQVRYGAMKCKEYLVEFQKAYFSLVYGMTTSAPLGPPSRADIHRKMEGERGVKMQTDLTNNHQLYINRKDHDDGDVTDDALINHPNLVIMRKCVQDIIDLLRKGMTNPNTECLCKPMPWTPLMIAVILNDIKAIRLMIREGADPNFPNMHGTTPVMLAAQINNIEAFLELIYSGGDMLGHDNEGYTPLAYATSLPSPICLKKSTVYFLMEGDTEGEKRITTDELLKVSIKFGNTVDLKEVVEKRKLASLHEVQEEQFRVLRLLEKYGLTRMETERHLQIAAKQGEWRVRVGADLTDNIIEYASETSSEQKSREKSEMAAAKRAAELEAKFFEDQLTRCPICTLSVPCAHFAKPALLKKFLKQNNSNEGYKAPKNAAEKAIQDMKKITRMKVVDKNQMILDEAHIGDRRTDRSIAVMKKYRLREMQLEKEAMEKYQKEIEYEKQRENKEIAIINGTYVEWQKNYNEFGQLYYLHSDTGEIWTKFTSDDGRDFYYNEVTNASRWDCPDEEGEKIRSAVQALVLSETNVENNTENKVEHHETENEPEIAPQDVAPTTPIKESVGLVSDNFVTPLKSVLKKHIDGTTAKKRVRIQFEDGSVEASRLEDGESSSTIEIKETSVGNASSEKSILTSSLAALVNTAYDIQIDKEIAEEKKKREEEKIALQKQEEEEESDDDLSKSGKSPKVSSAMAKALGTITSGSVRGVDNYGENPVPLVNANNNGVTSNSGRRLLMWTTERIDRAGNTDGLIHKQAPPIPNSPNKKQEEVLPMPTVQISGWTFVSFASIQSNPLQNLHLPMDVWGMMIEDVRSKFFSTWLPQMSLGTTIDVRTWKSKNPRCQVCHVGFCRLQAPKHSSQVQSGNSYPDHLLCLACLCRRELYERAKKVIPRSSSLRYLEWPFLPLPSSLDNTNDSISVDRPLSATGYPTSPGGTPYESLRQRSPIVSKRLHAIDTAEEMIVSSIKSDAISPWARVKDGALRLGGQLDNTSMSILEGSSVTSNLVGSSMSISTSSNLLEDESLESLSVYKEDRHGIRELYLLPYLISKGHFEDSERIIRAALENNAVDEGEGLSTLVKILSLAAELYKMLGLWPLALGLYLDCADLTAALLGFDDTITITAICQVSTCLRKMHYTSYAREYLNHICDDLRATYDPKRRSVAIRILDGDKYEIRELVNTEAIWATHISQVAPKSECKRRAFDLYGLGGLFHLLTSIEGHYVAAKVAFLNHCEHIKLYEINKYAHFVNYCFRMRTCSNHEIYRHLFMHILQKLIAKHMVEKSKLAETFYKITSIGTSLFK
jgi:ankyrin repeat protein/acyl-CoA-binding protein